jgi:copper chaperone CopZ
MVKKSKRKRRPQIKDSAPYCSDVAGPHIIIRTMTRCLRFVATPLIRFLYRSCLFEVVTAESTLHIQLEHKILRRKVMRYKLLVLFISLNLCGAAAADTIQVIVNGTVCGLCATGIEKTFRAQPEVKSVDVDLENKLVTIHTREGRTIDDSKIRELLGTAGYSVTGIVRKK